MRLLSLLACLGVLAIAAGAAGAAETSRLWGSAGELWDPAGRLPDFSFAGYRFGEVPIPQVPVVAKVTDFGARGDGLTDCTEAFRRAIRSTERGAILIPAGRYLIRDIITINKPGIVLRGAGAHRTVILIDRDLEEVRPNMTRNSGGRPTSGYSWSGGFLWVKGNIESPRLAAIQADAGRGTREIMVDDASRIEPGMRITIRQQDDAARSLISHLYSGDPGNVSKVRQPMVHQFTARVVAARGARVELDRPLRVDVRTGWSPAVHGYAPTVDEVGIEDLAIAFPPKPYAGHFTERGMNAIAMNGVSDCWVRNVKVSNCDSGVFLGGRFCTLRGIIFNSDRESKNGHTGHHGIMVGGDCLVENFIFETRFIHDITVSALASGSVIKNGRGPDVSFDHHKRAPHDNLFCRIDVGAGNSIWRCGGGADLGRHSGARTTFWAIESKKPVVWPPKGFGPDSMNLIGVRGDGQGGASRAGRWHEMIEPSLLEPSDLHAAQLRRRLGRQNAAP